MSDLNSRILPGIKDCVSMKVDGQRKKVQKRLLLLNSYDLYATFNESHPDENVIFSMFAKLRPKNCILAGARGTHAVCVYTIHETPNWHLNNCNDCPDIVDFASYLVDLLNDNPISDVKFNLWTGTDRSTL